MKGRFIELSGMPRQTVGRGEDDAPWQICRRPIATAGMKTPQPADTDRGRHWDGKRVAVFVRTPSSHFASSTPKYPPTSPSKIVLPLANQAAPLTRPFQSDNTNGNLAPSMAPQKAPSPMKNFSRGAGQAACVRRATTPGANRRGHDQHVDRVDHELFTTEAQSSQRIHAEGDQANRYRITEPIFQ